MKTIHKFPIRITDNQVVEMPAGSFIRHVGLDPHGAPTLWAHVDTDQMPKDRTLVITGTGHPVPDDLIHRGSFVDGSFVWHVWEKA